MSRIVDAHNVRSMAGKGHQLTNACTQFLTGMHTKSSALTQRHTHTHTHIHRHWTHLSGFANGLHEGKGFRFFFSRMLPTTIDQIYIRTNELKHCYET